MIHIKLSNFLIWILNCQFRYAAQEKRVIISSGLIFGLILISISIFISAAWVMNEFPVEPEIVKIDKQPLVNITQAASIKKNGLFKIDYLIRSGDTIITASVMWGIGRI